MFVWRFELSNVASGQSVETEIRHWAQSFSPRSPSRDEPGHTRKEPSGRCGKMSAVSGNRNTNTEPWGSFDENLIQVS